VLTLALCWPLEQLFMKLTQCSVSLDWRHVAFVTVTSLCTKRNRPVYQSSYSGLSISLTSLYLVSSQLSAVAATANWVAHSLPWLRPIAAHAALGWDEIRSDDWGEWYEAVVAVTWRAVAMAPVAKWPVVGEPWVGVPRTWRCSCPDVGSRDPMTSSWPCGRLRTPWLIARAL